MLRYVAANPNEECSCLRVAGLPGPPEVYAEDFPQRRLSSGRLVRSLAELIEYLAALADGVEAPTVGVEAW